MWTVRKCWSNRSLNSRSCSEGLPNLPSVLNLVCGQQEHVPTTGFLPCHLMITRLGFFMPSVFHRPMPITSLWISNCTTTRISLLFCRGSLDLKRSLTHHSGAL